MVLWGCQICKADGLLLGGIFVCGAHRRPHTFILRPEIRSLIGSCDFCAPIAYFKPFLRKRGSDLGRETLAAFVCVPPQKKGHKANCCKIGCSLQSWNHLVLRNSRFHPLRCVIHHFSRSLGNLEPRRAVISWLLRSSAPKPAWWRDDGDLGYRVGGGCWLLHKLQKVVQRGCFVSLSFLPFREEFERRGAVA